MKYENSLASRGIGLREQMEVIADNMLKLRPRGEVEYRPYRKTDIYYDKHLDLRIIDLKKLYPEARAGQVVYISTVIEACVETDAKINFIGNAKVFFDGKYVFDSLTDGDEDGKCRCALHLKKGANPLRFTVRCDSDERFEFRFMPSVRWYWIWAKCYLLSARATSPISCYEGEDGVAISRLYDSENEEYEGDVFYPVPEKFGNTLDFYRVFPYEKGKTFYALTYAMGDGSLEIGTKNEYKLLVNGEARLSPVLLKKGDTVLLKLSGGERAEFIFECEKGVIGIPFMRSSRESGDEWLTVGGFDGGSDEVETEIQFKRPYKGSDGKEVFWKLSGENDYLRPYLATRFFGQWHYTFMVGGFGLLNAWRTLGKEEYREYF